MNIENSHNFLHNSRIDAEGNVIVGDNNIILNLKEAADYIRIEKEISELSKAWETCQKRIAQYPKDNSFQDEADRLAMKRVEKEKELAILKKEVIALADIFERIPINTERLKKAESHFKAGDFKAARAILDAEKMGIELEALLEQKSKLREKTTVNEKHLRSKADEFLILARLTVVDFDLPKRFEQSKIYFEKSLRANRNGKNSFAYAHFLTEHNQNSEAIPLCKEALDIYKKLTEKNPESYLPDVAKALNNLGVLQAKTNHLSDAEKSLQEALAKYRKLAKKKPVTYWPDVARTLNNLGTLQATTSRFSQAEKSYQEALTKYRKLTKKKP